MRKAGSEDPPLILVVDDQLFTRQMVRDWVEQAGFAVEEAENGLQALDAFRRLRPDLILLDVVMPIMDGFTACAELRKLPGGDQIPVLVMTGLDDVESIQKAYGVGATDFIQKPINGVVLGHRIRYMLRASRTAQQLRRSEAKLANAQRIAALGYWELDPKTNELTGSAELHAIFGIRPEAFGATWEAFLDCVHPDDRQSVERLLNEVLEDHQPRSADFRVVRPEGSERVVHQHAEVAAAESNGEIRVSGTLQDITDRRRAEEQIQFLAFYDGLTGLPNRRHVLDRVNVLLSSAKRQGNWVATLFVGVNHFKRISDTLGHRAGDQLLQAITERLLQGVSSPQGPAAPQVGEFEPFVGRFGGDEFVVVLGGVGRVQDVARVARRVTEALKRSFTIGDRDVFASASIGVSLYPFDGRDPESLLRNAATAMSHARSWGTTDYQFYTESMNAAALKQLILETNLRKALEREEFTLHYQPQVDLGSGEIVGAEALIRWQSPDLGMVMPLDFIPLAEETGLIFPIGDWVLRAACAQAKQWQDAGLPPLRMAVNVSARQFGQQDFTRNIAQALEGAELGPQYLDSELTESTVMQDVDSAILSLREMKAMGLHVSVDDFGTGYSSLSYLRSFPIDALKIDRSFLSGLPQDADHAAITTAIIAMAKSLKLRVIAEGVASKEQLDFLRDKGCDEAQGHLFSYPIPADEFVQLMQEQWNPSEWGRSGV